MADKKQGSEDLDLTDELLAIDKVKQAGAIETEHVSAGGKAAELDAFMNEFVGVLIAPTNEDGALPVVPISVNGRDVHVVRGIPTRVRRCHVEVLLHAIETTYTQQQNMLDPANAPLRPKSSVSYPFQITEDTAKGRRWFAELTKSMQRG